MAKKLKVRVNIFEALRQVSDPRILRGRRHNLAVILLINIMAIMSGYTGIRSKQDFIDRNKQELINLFDPKLVKHGLPCKNTIDRSMQFIDYDNLNKVLNQLTDLPLGSSVHIDGKAIRSTTQNGQSAKQTFTSIVTAFAKDRGIQAKSFTNGSKKHEISVVQELIQALGLEGMVLTLDALHCQKKL
jgi:hypothetical protein